MAFRVSKFRFFSIQDFGLGVGTCGSESFNGQWEAKCEPAFHFAFMWLHI